MSKTSSRKRDHVELCVNHDVAFRGKTTGLERYELLYNALPELDFSEVDTRVEFLGKKCGMPLLISSMTGGYGDAAAINQQLAEVCQTLQIPMGVGSQRQAMERASVQRGVADPVSRCSGIWGVQKSPKPEALRQSNGLLR